MADQKCAHKPCKCMEAELSTSGVPFCSEFCANAVPAEDSSPCGCGHAGCG